MISKKNIQKSTEVSNDGKNLIITNPLIECKLPIDINYIMSTNEIVDFVSIITFLYLKIGAEKNAGRSHGPPRERDNLTYFIITNS